MFMFRTMLISMVVLLVFGVGSPMRTAGAQEAPEPKTAKAAPTQIGDWMLIWTMNLGSAKPSDAVSLFASLAPDVEGKFPSGYLWHRFFVDEATKTAGFVSAWTVQPSLDRIAESMPAAVSKITDFFMTHGLTESDYTVRILRLLPPKTTEEDAIRNVISGMFKAISAGNVDAAVAFFTDDVELSMETPEGPRTISGKESVRQGMSQAPPEMANAFKTVPPLTVKIDGNTASVSYTQYFRFPRPDGSGIQSMPIPVSMLMKKVGGSWKIAKVEYKAPERQP
jgi:ketosteroid isomerase-like protein